MTNSGLGALRAIRLIARRTSMSDHHHSDSHDELPLEQKLLKLLEHWVKHNTDHAVTYRNWAEKAKANGMSEVASLLQDAADASLQINDLFRQASASASGG